MRSSILEIGKHQVCRKTVESELENFSEIFPTIDECIDFLFYLLYPNGEMPCRNCSLPISSKPVGSRVVYCKSCKKDTWFLANTGFERTRKIRERMAVTWLLEKGVPINSSVLEKTLGLVRSTAWEIFNDVNSKLAYSMSDFPSVSKHIFSDIISKRSAFSPACAHPRAELDELPYPGEQEHEDCNAESKYDSCSTSSFNTLPSSTDITSSTPDEHATISSDQEKVLTFLTTQGGSPRFDSIALETGIAHSRLCMALVLLEIDMKIVRGAGDTYQLKKGVPTKGSLEPAVLEATEIAKNLLATCFKGISLRHLQSYLAFAWIILDRSTWSKAGLILSKLIRADSVPGMARDYRTEKELGFVSIFARS